ncbi:MAG TPA: tetratricopeptide repeat protein [Anaeromyxobacter sp.]|nr:tetratricopeptide repeat protein [Anaeromyxobacter sp.]
MANSTVIRRKDMKEPDRFQVLANQASQWLAARKKKVTLAGGVAVAVVVVVGIVAAVQSSRAEAAGFAASALLQMVNAPVGTPAAEGAAGKTFPTNEAKQQAIVAEADKVLTQYRGSHPAVLAELVKANALYALKDWDKAAGGYQQFLADAPADDSLRFGALQGLALAAEAKGDLAGAAQAWERMEREAPLFADQADLERARVLAASGKLEEARQLLQKFPENHKDSGLVEQASEQLAALGAK